MKTRILATAATVALILGIAALNPPQSYADALGLTNGDYDITITGAFTGSGTISIGTGFVSAYDIIANGVEFADICTAPGDDSFCPGGAATNTNNALQFTSDIPAPERILAIDDHSIPESGHAFWLLLGGVPLIGEWSAERTGAQVPEPAPAALLFFGFSALGLYRRYFAK